VNLVCHAGKPQQYTYKCKKGEVNLISISNTETICIDIGDPGCQVFQYENLNKITIKDDIGYIKKGTLLGYVKKKDLAKFKFSILHS
jgi:hypothetical protein